MHTPVTKNTMAGRNTLSLFLVLLPGLLFSTSCAANPDRKTGSDTPAAAASKENSQSGSGSKDADSKTVDTAPAGGNKTAADKPKYKWKNNYHRNPKFREFINTAVTQHKFDRDKLMKLFSQVKPRPDVIRAMNRQAEDLPWYRYKKYFLKRKRIMGGVRFWNRNARVLRKASRQYGVPPEIIVAIIGVESLYGKRKGKNRIIESLSTLAFEYPRRAAFFQKELLQFLLLAREEKLNPARLTGSYAGAMGMPQFISSSYRRYAIDFDKNGRRDLYQSRADVIGSVANYFNTFGWIKGQPVTTRARVRGRRYRKLPKQKLKPRMSLKRYRGFGIRPRWRPNRWNQGRKATLLTLDQKRYKEYWLGFHNFYVISRYNHSTHYSMAVYQLSRRIKQARLRQIRRNRKRRRRR